MWGVVLFNLTRGNHSTDKKVRLIAPRQVLIRSLHVKLRNVHRFVPFVPYTVGKFGRVQLALLHLSGTLRSHLGGDLDPNLIRKTRFLQPFSALNPPSSRVLAIRIATSKVLRALKVTKKAVVSRDGAGVLPRLLPRDALTKECTSAV